MPSRIDLSQCWKDHPEYRGHPKEFGIFGNTGALAGNATNLPISVTIDEGVDFLATAIYCVPVQAAAPVYESAPFLAQVNLPSGRSLLEVPRAQGGVIPPQRFDYMTFAQTNFLVAWDWPYPLRLTAMGIVTTVWDNPRATAYVMNVAFHGVKVFL